MSTPALGSEKAEMGQGGGAESWGTQRGRAQMGEQLGESRRERLMTRKGRKGWRVRSWVRPHSEHGIAKGLLATALPAVWAHCCLSPHLQVFLEARGSSLCHPTFGHSHLSILSTSWQPLANSSGRGTTLLLRALNLMGEAAHKILTH